jgi:hypothetical protein
LRDKVRQAIISLPIARLPQNPPLIGHSSADGVREIRTSS